MNLQVLKAELDAGGYDPDDHIAADQLNEKSVSAKQPISTSDIKKYMLLNDLWLPIEASAGTAAKVSLKALELFDEFNVDEPPVLSKLTQMLDGLIAASLISAADKTAILSMGDTLISRAEELGLPVVKGGDVQRARAL